MKKAAILTNQLLGWFDGLPAIGGLERYVFQLADLLVDLGYETTVYQRTFQPAFSKHYRNINIVGYNIKSSTAEIDICNNFYEATKDCSVHIVTMADYAKGKIHDRTIIAVSGNVWFNKTPDRLNEEDKKLLNKVYSESSCIVVMYPYTKKLLKDISPKNIDKVIVIENGIYSDIFVPPIDGDRENLIIFPGRAELYKGTKIYKELIKLHSESKFANTWKMLWIGDGTQFNDLENKIHVLPKDMPGIYQRAKISCTFLTYDGLRKEISADGLYDCSENDGEIGTPLTQLEGMSSGCACVSFGYTQDTIINGVNGRTVSRNDSKLIYSVLCELMENEEEIIRLGNNARETVLNRFSLDSWKSGWKKVIDENQMEING